MARNLDLALRIRADLGNAKQTLDRLERELKQTGAAGRTAAQGTGQAARNVDRVASSSNRAARNLERAERRMRRFEGASGRAARSLNGLYFALGGLGAAAAIQSLVDAGLEIEKLEQRFTFAAGGIAAGAQELAFIRAEAERIGISFGAAASGYSSLLAASRGTNVSLEQTREIFLGVAEASAVLRLSQDEIAGALRAVQQIMSKGTLQAEEIRGQLGERLPGAFQIAARAMGVTTAELNKMLELGQVVSDEFLPRFAAQLRKEFAEGVPDAADSAAASFARLGNAIERLQQSIAKSGVLEFLADLTDRINIAGQQFGLFTQEPARAVASLRSDLLGVDDDIGKVQSRIASLSAELDILAGRDDALSRRAAGAVQRRIDAARRTLTQLQVQAEILREEIAARQADIPGLQPPGAPAASGAPAADREADAEAEARIKAEERANAQLEQIRRRYINQYLRLGLNAIELEERRRIEALDRIDEIEAAGGSAEKAAFARLAVNQRTSAAIREIHKQEFEEALRNEERLAEERKRASEEALRLLEEETERRIQLGRTWQDGAARAFRAYAESAADAADIAEETIGGSLRSLEDAVAQFVTTGKLNFADLANSILADFARLQTNRLLGGLLGNLGGLFGGGGFAAGVVPGGTLFFHGGGTVGSGAQNRRSGVDPRSFAFARRYHNGGIAGLRPDEVPAILERGERVQTAEQAQASDRPRVLRIVLEGRDGEGRVTDEREFDFDLEGAVEQVVTANIASGGTIGRQIEGIVRQGGL